MELHDLKEQPMNRAISRLLTMACAPILSMILSNSVSAGDLLVQGPSGGSGGRVFADMHPDARVVGVRVRSGAFIDGIGLVYRVGNKRVEGPWHGGTGGTSSLFELENGESITSIGGKTGKFVDSLWVKTSKGRTRKWGGSGGSSTYRYVAPAGGRLAGLWGRSGKFLDAVGPAFTANGGTVAARNLGGFAQEAPGGPGPGDEKADGVQSVDFPQPATQPGSSAWLRELADNLNAIVRRLAGSSSVFSSYRQKEASRCGTDVPCLIWFRQGAIAYVVSGD